MKFARVSLLAGGLGLLATTTLAQAPAGAPPDFLGLLQRIYAHYSILLTRSVVDLTYDSITVEPGTNALIVSGLKVYPGFDWDEEGQCRIAVDRVVFGSSYGFETVSTTIEVSGISAPPDCFTPDVGDMIAGFGYDDGLVADSMSLEIAYDLPSSGAEVSLQAAVMDAADITISASFDYIWVRLPLDGGDEPVPVVILGGAEIALENAGLWERLEPMLAAQMGDLDAIPGMAQQTLGQMMAGPDGQTPPEALAFAENVSTELQRFISERNRLVVTVSPEDGLFLEEDTFGSPAEAIALLRPEISGIPVAYRSLIGQDELTAALAGGGDLDDAARIRVGEALLTGLGAPRSLSDGKALLAPLAEAWNGEAAYLLAGALAESGTPRAAYGMALRAQAGGAAGAIGMADGLEGQIEVADILSTQQAAAADWPGAGGLRTGIEALIGAGDISGLRRMAHAASVGRDMPRDYRTAYYLASLAAAGGDRGAANLRRRLDSRFAARDAQAWRADADAAAREALETWTSQLGAIIAARVQ